jgi:hypothetical protein
VENKMKKLAISVLATAVVCGGVYGMEIHEHHETESNKYPKYTKLFPREFWLDTEMVSQCTTEAKKNVVKEIVERELEGNPLDYCSLLKDYTWSWICKNAQYNKVDDRGRFTKSIRTQFPDVNLPFLDVIKELGLEEQYWTKEGWPVGRIRRHRK